MKKIKNYIVLFAICMMLFVSVIVQNAIAMITMIIFIMLFMVYPMQILKFFTLMPSAK